jgi:hypothetical protein
MGKKILVIGCSHSAGAYDKADNVISNESWAWHLKNIRNTDDKYYVIHNPANGILHYGAIVKYLNHEGLLNQFDSCIVQMTSEMRMMFYDNMSNAYFPLLKEWLQSANDEFNIRPEVDYFHSPKRTLSNYVSDVFNKYKGHFNGVEAKSAWLTVCDCIIEGIGPIGTKKDTKAPYTVNAIYDIYYYYIVNTLRENGVEPVVFDWWYKGEVTKDLKHGDEWILDSVVKTAIARGDWHKNKINNSQHHNSDSAKLMASIINSAIEEHRKLQ